VLRSGKLAGEYLLMVRAVGLYRQPVHPCTKIVDKSIFPTSNANSDAGIEFYAKFYVGIHSTGGGSVVPFKITAAAEKYYNKNEVKFYKNQ
jgi:hypothetical protein